MTIQKLQQNIHEMFRLDQFLRLNAKSRVSSEDLAPMEYSAEKFRDTFNQILPNILIYILDGIHKDKLKNIFKESVITKELIGEESMKELWLLIMHQDLEIQEYAKINLVFDEIEMMKLEDRILINRGEPQRYDTHKQSEV